MSFKPEVETINEPGKFYGNALVFATYAEALYSARDLMNRWMLVTDCRAVESDKEVNYEINLETGEMNERKNQIVADRAENLQGDPLIAAATGTQKL